MKVICIAGPTASGKTGLSIGLAQEIGGEIISCDSVAVYKGFDIGSAKPTPEEQRGVKHHMLSVADACEPWNAGIYSREAARSIETVNLSGKVPIICGGTGLWLKALLEGIDDIPECPREDHGDNVYKKLREVDPETASRLSPADKIRINRALDVFEATGKPISYFRTGRKEPRYNVLTIILECHDRDFLRGRIRKRTADMLNAGLLNEIRNLLNEGVPPDCPPMLSIGYKQAADFLLGNTKDLEGEINLRTAQYAKRQTTWFSRQLNGIRHEITLGGLLETVKTEVENFLLT